MAYAQTPMKVEIPFAFHTANATLPACSYLVYRGGNLGPTVVTLENASSRHAVLAMAEFVDPHDRAAKPSVVFACGNGGCSLTSIRTATGAFTYPSPHKAAREQEAFLVVSVPMTTREGD